MPYKNDSQSKVRAYNRDQSLRGMRGYPTDKEYMGEVGKAALENSDNAMDAAARALSEKGTELHTHEMNIRRTANGYVAKHTLGDSKGNPPTDGQKPSVEYNVNPGKLADHVDQHMGSPIPSDDDSDDEPPQGK
jgi:hypothetical protein